MTRSLTDYLVFREQVQACARNTLRQDRGQLLAFLRYCAGEGVSLEQVDLPFLRRFLLAAGDGLKKSTVASKITTLKQFFHFCHRTGRLPNDPGQALVPPRAETLERLPYVPSPEEIAQLCQNALVTGRPFHRARNFAALQLLYATGLRPFELVSLDFTDVDLEQRTLCVRVRKSRNAQQLPLLDCAAEALERYFPQRERRPRLDAAALFVNKVGPRWSVHGLRGAFRRLRVGLDDRLTPYSLRHAFATHLVEDDDVSLFQLQQLLGHCHERSTFHYLHLQPRLVRDRLNQRHPLNALTATGTGPSHRDPFPVAGGSGEVSQ